MTRYIIRRILIAIPVLIGISFIVSAMVSFAPGDAISLMLSNESVNVANVTKLKTELGLDKPWYIQYGRYMMGLLRGDMGRSIHFNRPVSELIGEKIGNTVKLALLSCLFAVVVSIPLGVLAAAKRRSVYDYSSSTIALIGVSMPSFFLGILLILLFGLKLGWLPIRGLPSYNSTLWKQLRHLILPSITLGASLAGILTRLTRSCMLEALGQDFARTARAKGQSQMGVLFKHALPNAFLPILTTLGMQFGSLLGGAVIIETIFSLPGLGLLAMDAVKFRDLPLIQGTVLVFAFSFVVVMLLVDVAYVFLDPRIKYD